MDHHQEPVSLFPNMDAWSNRIPFCDENLSLYLDPDLQFRAKTLYDLTAYWLKKRAERRMPSRADIDPADIRFLLPYVFLVDVKDDHPHLRWRLMGTHINEYLGYDATGRWFDELYENQTHEKFMRSFLECLSEKKPERFHGKIRFPSQDYLGYEAVYLPLSSNSTRVEMLLGGMVFTPSYWIEGSRH
ncbi:PAS domain-containing protein [Rhodovibrionaceae bacterium A322]